MKGDSSAFEVSSTSDEKPLGKNQENESLGKVSTVSFLFLRNEIFFAAY